jgi:hypothetical protein
MRYISLVILVSFISLAMLHCGAGTLTSARAKEIIVEEVRTVMGEFLEAEGENLSEEEKREVEKKIKEFGQFVKVTGVKKEGDSFIAKVELKIEDETINSDFRFNRYDTGWKVDGIKTAFGLWAPFSTLLAVVKNSLDRVSIAGKMKATLIDLKRMGWAIESYITDRGQAPQRETLRELKELLEPFHIREVPLKDAWGNDYYYYHGTGKAKTSYAIASAGSDGKFAGFEQKGDYMDYKGKDIIFSNGVFTYRPNIQLTKGIR